jgi:hypothetical protein
MRAWSGRTHHNGSRRGNFRPRVSYVARLGQRATTPAYCTYTQGPDMSVFQNEDRTKCCMRCEHWGFENGHVTLCARGPGVQAIARPEFGCAFFTRAIELDDEAAPGRGKRPMLPPVR